MEFTKEHCERIKQSKLGKKLSVSTKLKISRTMKRKFKNGEIVGNLGYKFTDEQKRKLSLSHIGYVMPESQKIKIGLASKNKTISIEHKQRLRESALKQFKNGMPKNTREKLSKSHKGKKASEETKKKISDSHKGKKHWNWLGGKSFEKYGIEFNQKLREVVREIDCCKCQLCLIHQDKLSQKLSIHHIDYDKKNNIMQNLISLCRKCHQIVHFERQKWRKYFIIKRRIDKSYLK